MLKAAAVGAVLAAAAAMIGSVHAQYAPVPDEPQQGPPPRPEPQYVPTPRRPDVPPPPRRAELMPPMEAMTVVRSMGLSPVGKPVSAGGTYVVRAVDRRGDLVRVVVDA